MHDFIPPFSYSGFGFTVTVLELNTNSIPLKKSLLTQNLCDCAGVVLEILFHKSATLHLVFWLPSGLTEAFPT